MKNSFRLLLLLIQNTKYSEYRIHGSLEEHFYECDAVFK